MQNAVDQPGDWQFDVQLAPQNNPNAQVQCETTVTVSAPPPVFSCSLQVTQPSGQDPIVNQAVTFSTSIVNAYQSDAFEYDIVILDAQGNQVNTNVSTDQDLPGNGLGRAPQRSFSAPGSYTVRFDIESLTYPSSSAFSCEVPVTVEQGGSFTDCSDVTSIPQAECEALVALYDTAGGSNRSTTTNWKQNNDPCSRWGVKCSTQQGKVTGLDFDGNPNGSTNFGPGNNLV